MNAHAQHKTVLLTLHSHPTKLAVSLIALWAALWIWAGESARGGQTPETPDATTASACLNVTGTIPAPGGRFEDRIVVVFDKEIAPLDHPDVAAFPMTLIPGIAGHFETGPNFISFKPFGPIPSNTVFHATLNPDLRSRDGKPLNPNQRALTCASFVFEPREVWMIENETGRTVLGVSFPADVELADLAKRVSVVDADGKATSFTLQPSQGGGRRDYRLVFGGGVNWPLKITFAKGLPDANHEFQLANDREFRYSLTSAPALAVARLEWRSFKPDVQTIEILFTQAVRATDLRSHLTITDDRDKTNVPFEVVTKAQTNEHLVNIRMKTPETVRVSVKISKGLPSANQATLESAYERLIERKLDSLYIEEAQFRTSYDGNQRKGVLGIRLNKSVSADDLSKHLVLKPEAPGMTVRRRYDNYFEVAGEWVSNQYYEARVTGGVKDAEGIVWPESKVAQFKTGKIPSSLQFSHKGKYYFPRRSPLPLTLQTRNVDKVNLVLHRVFPSNVALAVSSIRDGRPDYEFISKWSEKVASQETPIQAASDRLTDSPVDLKSLFPPGQKGVFCLEATGKDEIRDEKVVLQTDIGLLCHWTGQELLLFAHDLFSLAPLPSARVSVYSTKNQLMAQANTGAGGMVHITSLNASLGAPDVVVVERENDYTFLELRTRQEDAERIPSTAAARYDRAAYDAFLYTDRNLYRPGETVHLRWTVRTNYGDAVSSVPLLLTIYKPRNIKLLSQLIVLSQLGTGGLDIETQQTYPTGGYRAQVSTPGADNPLGTATFNIEEFVPNRMQATVALGETLWQAGKEYRFHVNAKHLFGAPASGRRCDAEVTFRREPLKTKIWKEYRFDNDSDYTPDRVQCGESETDAQGAAEFKFLWIPPAKATMPMKAIVTGRVYELGGRPVGNTKEVVVLPSDICLGIAASGNAQSGALDISVAAIRPDESPAPLDKVSVALEKQVWNYYVRRYYDHGEPNWSESFEAVETREVSLKDGRGAVTFPIGDYGYYRVRVFSDKTPQYSTVSFYKSWRRQIDLVTTARPSLIKIALDKPVYDDGEEAEIRIESQFDGKGVVVIQGERFYQMTPLDIKNGAASVRFRVEREHAPNLWVEATAIHAIKEGEKQVYPFSSLAVAELKVRDRARVLNVSFPSLPEEVRPARAVQFQIAAADAQGKPVAAELTLAAVDEGIHQILRYANPDPFGWFTRSRRPSFAYAHYYDKVAYQFEKAAPGGGEPSSGAEVAKRLAGADRSWIKPVALWSGVVRTGGDGRTTVTMELPEFAGQLRLVAVACASKSFGSGAADIYVRRPYMLQTSMPRFVLPEDVFQCRATIYNQTDKPCRTRVKWSSKGALAATEGTSETEIAAKGEWSAPAQLAAGAAMGQGEIQWEAVIFDPSSKAEIERLAESDQLPVRTPAVYQSFYELAILKPGESRSFRNTRVLDDERAELEMSCGANPQLRLEEALKHVVGYPYGCVEQTTSRLMPLYLLRQNDALVEAALGRQVPLDQYLRSGIDRLFSMQTVTGGLVFWPGDTSDYPYGSVYAMHFLTLVEKGRLLELPKENLDRLREYVRNTANSLSPAPTPGDFFLRAYATYVLAIGGDQKAIEQIERFDNVNVPLPARLLLAAALAQQTQDNDRIRLYLSQAPSSPFDVRLPDATLNSNVRNTAIEVLALRKIGASDAKTAQQIQEKAQILIDFLGKNHYGTTQETAFIVSALSEYLSDFAKNIDEAAAAISDGKEKKEIKGKEVYRAKRAGKGWEFNVSNTGRTSLFVNLATRGMPEKPETKATSQGIAVARDFFDSDGKRHDPARFKQGELVVARLTIDCQTDLKNVIVADLLPAGLEIENPRLNPKNLRGGAFADASTASHLEVRDDRLIAAFDGLAKGERHFCYIVRAVTPGQYDHPPVTAECMYDAAIHASSKPSRVTVSPF